MMKNKWFALLLALIILSSFTGCGRSEQYEVPLSFYYLSAQLDYGADSAAIKPQLREGKGFSSPETILQLYFAGPLGEDFKTPFPAGLRLVSTAQEADTLYLTVSDELSQLSGLDLTLACCCITLTCLDITDVESVCIQAETATLGGEKTITMNRDCLLLLDHSNQASPE